MALKILYTHIDGTLTADISATTQLIPIDSDSLAILLANVDFSSGDWTYLTLSNEIYSEEVKVISIQGAYIQVLRAQSGSTAQVFSATDTNIVDHVGSQAIQDIVAASPATVDVAVQGQGIASVSSSVSGTTTTYTVDVELPAFTGTDGITVTGTWPNLSFAYEGNDAGCCSGSSSSSTTGGLTSLIVNSSILTGDLTNDILTLGLTAPTFTGAGGVTVTGSWAVGYTITGGGAGGTGTVEQVYVGTGLTLSGTPTVNPTLSLSNTGVTAGTYGDITINAQGQITAITSGFAPVGNVVLTNGGNITQVGSTYNITLNTAAVGVAGIVELADSSVAFDSSDDTTAATPKVVANAIASLATSLVSAGSSTGEAAASYTNTISSTNISLTLTSGQKALILGEVDVYDTSGGTVPNFGVALLTSGGTALYSSRILEAGKQSILGVLTGPLSTVSAALATTALTSTQSVTGATLAAIIF